jgi:hypothetical protein
VAAPLDVVEAAHHDLATVALKALSPILGQLTLELFEPIRKFTALLPFMSRKSLDPFKGLIAAGQLQPASFHFHIIALECRVRFSLSPF